jgi:ATP-dependent Lhr-like helicase
MNLRPYQSDAIAAVYEHLRSRDDNPCVVIPTGGGKTLAGFLPSLIDLAENPRPGLHTLYVSPLKALAVDIARNLTAPVTEMDLPIRIETRTGDTPVNRRQRQRGPSESCCRCWP